MQKVLTARVRFRLQKTTDSLNFLLNNDYKLIGTYTYHSRRDWCLCSCGRKPEYTLSDHMDVDHADALYQTRAAVVRGKRRTNIAVYSLEYGF